MYWFNADAGGSRLQVSTYVDSYLNGASATTLAVTVPGSSQAANGDLMVMVVETNLYYWSGVPAGWELVASNSAFTTNRASIYVYQRVKDGTEAATVTWGPANSACAIAARVLVIPGADKIVNQSSTFSTSSVSLIPTPTLSVTMPGSLFFRMMSLYRTSGTPLTPSPTYGVDMTPMPEVHSNTSFFTTLAMAYKNVPIPELEPLYNHTINPTSRYASMSLEVVPKMGRTIAALQQVTLTASQQNVPTVDTDLVGWTPRDANSTASSAGLVVRGDGPVNLTAKIDREYWSGAGTAIFKLDGVEITRVDFGSYSATLPAGLNFYVKNGQVLSVTTNTANAGGSSKMQPTSYLQITPI
ncbi:hypothetical protein [Streptomyces vietnamensis]|uniref:hypothetical protein n=4 Tax=Actinomycetota TaxID=201174 RepID=UPI003448C20A